MVITVALDQSADDARPFIDAAAPTHPSLIDTEHVVADLYGIDDAHLILYAKAAKTRPPNWARNCLTCSMIWRKKNDPCAIILA